MKLQVPCFQQRHSSSALRSEGPMQRAALAALSGPSQGRDWRGQEMEKKMRLLTYLELTRYTKAQLESLYWQINSELGVLAKNSPEHQYALLNMQHIRLFLARRNFRPGSPI